MLLQPHVFGRKCHWRPRAPHSSPRSSISTYALKHGVGVPHLYFSLTGKIEPICLKQGILHALVDFLRPNYQYEIVSCAYEDSDNRINLQTITQKLTPLFRIIIGTDNLNLSSYNPESRCQIKSPLNREPGLDTSPRAWDPDHVFNQ